MKKEDKEKIVNKIFSKLFLLLFITFMAIYISGKSGYYEYKARTQTTLTKAKIKKFESDVKKGKNIDLKDYTKEEVVNYDNKMSELGLKISKGLGNIIKLGLEETFDFLNDQISG